MSTTTVGWPTPGFDREEYVRLLSAWPPVKIRDEAAARATEVYIGRLLSRADLSLAERAYLDLLSDLVADWEDIHDEISDIHGVELVRALLEDRALRQRDLVGIFATESTVSDVLSGRRELTRRHIEGLSRFFGVSPAAFFPATKRVAAPAHGV